MNATSHRSADNVSPGSNEQDASLASPALSAQPQGEREAFEAWVKARGDERGSGWWLRQLPDGGYSAHLPDVAWSAWQARASLSASTPSAEARLERVKDAITEALGDAYDCTRVWRAWGTGTMSQDDFVPVVEQDDRLSEIASAAIAAMCTPPADKENGNGG